MGPYETVWMAQQIPAIGVAAVWAVGAATLRRSPLAAAALALLLVTSLGLLAADATTVVGGGLPSVRGWSGRIVDVGAWLCLLVLLAALGGRQLVRHSWRSLASVPLLACGGATPLVIGMLLARGNLERPAAGTLAAGLGGFALWGLLRDRWWLEVLGTVGVLGLSQDATGVVGHALVWTVYAGAWALVVAWAHRAARESAKFS